MESRSELILKNNLKIDENDSRYKGLAEFLDRDDINLNSNSDSYFLHTLFEVSIEATKTKIKNMDVLPADFKTIENEEETSFKFPLNVNAADNLRDLLPKIAYYMAEKGLVSFKYGEIEFLTDEDYRLLDCYPLVENENGSYQFIKDMPELQQYFNILHEKSEQQISSTLPESNNDNEKQALLDNPKKMHNWIRKYNEIKGSHENVQETIRLRLRKDENVKKNNPYLVNPSYTFLLVEKMNKKKPEWYLYHLNEKKELVIRSVEKDPSLENLKNVLLADAEKNRYYSINQIVSDRVVNDKPILAKNMPAKVTVENVEDVTVDHVANNVKEALNDYFRTKAELKSRERNILDRQPRAIHKIHSSAWDHNQDIEKQADYIWENYVKPQLDKGKKVALLYSASQKQAEMLYRNYYYFDGPPLSSIFERGKGQAKIFKLIAECIERENRRDQVHILPIPTSLKGGEDTPSNQPSFDQINVALRNVENHKAAGFTIFGLADDKDNYLIGGGRSKSWDKVDPSTGISRKMHVDTRLPTISNKNILIDSKQSLKLSLFDRELTTNLIMRINSLIDCPPVIQQMQTAISNLAGNYQALWEELVKICRNQIKPFKRNTAQIDLLCHAIAEFDANLRMKPEIKTLDQLIIMQQKRNAINNWLRDEQDRLGNENKDYVVELKLQAYKYLENEIKQSDIDTPLSVLIAEDSDLLQRKMIDKKNINHVTLQKALYRKRGAFLSEATSKSKLNHLRDELFEIDPRTVLNFDKKIIEKNDNTLLYQIDNTDILLSNIADYKESHALLSSLLIARDSLSQHEDDRVKLNRLINEITYITNSRWPHCDDQQLKELMMSKIREAYAREERRFRKPTLGLFGKSGQDFRNVLKQKSKGNHSYALNLLQILQGHSDQINPNLSVNTSDHTYQTISVNFSTFDHEKQNEYRLNGLTWNLRDKMQSEKHGQNFRNNPWNTDETFKKYLNRKGKQLTQLSKMIESNTLDFVFLQDVPFLMHFSAPQDVAKKLSLLQKSFIEMFKKNGWEMLQSSVGSKPFVTFYNTKTLKPLDTNLEAILDKENPFGSYGNTRVLTHIESNQKINLTNLYLNEENIHDKVNDTLSSHQQSCITNNQILIAGGDFNRPSNHLSNAIIIPNRITHLQGEMLDNSLIHLKRKHEDVKGRKGYSHDDSFIVNGTKDCFITSVTMGGQEFKKTRKGQYNVVKSNQQTFLPYQINNGTYSYAHQAKCEKLINEIKNELKSYIEDYKEKTKPTIGGNIRLLFNKEYIRNLQQKQQTAKELFKCIDDIELIKEFLADVTHASTLQADNGRLNKIYNKCLTLPMFIQAEMQLPAANYSIKLDQ